MPNALKRTISNLSRSLGYEIKRWRHPTQAQVDQHDPLLNIRAFFQSHSITPRVVLDVGANQGDYADHCLRLFPASSVYCFEPTPAVLERLRNRFASNPRVKIIEAAVVESDAPVTFHLRGEDVWNSVLADGQSGIAPGATQRVEVRGIKLDTFAAEQGIGQVDLLKLDIQGAEHKALLGAGQLLRDGRMALVQMEMNFQNLYSGQADFQTVSKLMFQNGYWPVGLYQPSMLNGLLCAIELVFAHSRYQ